MKQVKSLFFGIVLILLMAVPAFAQENIDAVVNGEVSENAISAATGDESILNCGYTATRYYFLTTQTTPYNYHHLSTINFQLPSGVNECAFKYKLKHEYLAKYFEASQQITCTYYDNEKTFLCEGIARQDLMLYFYITNQPLLDIYSRVDDWVHDVQTGWIIRGWTTFITIVNFGTDN